MIVSVSIGQEPRLTGCNPDVSWAALSSGGSTGELSVFKLTWGVGMINFLVVGGLKASLCHWMSAGDLSWLLEAPTVPMAVNSLRPLGESLSWQNAKLVLYNEM